MNDYTYLKQKLQEILDAWGEEINDDDVGCFHYLLEEYLDHLDSFKLYKYVKADYYNLRNLEKQRIYLSPSGTFNDVYEGLPIGKFENLSYEKLKALTDLAYISCFSERKDSLLMWSHYANSHKGFCVEYDLKLLHFISEDSYHYDDEEEYYDEEDCFAIENIYPVIYSKKRMLNFETLKMIRKIELLGNNIQPVDDEGEDYDRSILSKVLPMFVNKGSDWKYEREWRIILTKEELDWINDYGNKKIANNTIPFKCVSGIYLGFRIDPEVKENILEIAQRLQSKCGKINVYQAKLSDNEYKLKFEKIDI